MIRRRLDICTTTSRTTPTPARSEARARSGPAPQCPRRRQPRCSTDARLGDSRSRRGTLSQGQRRLSCRVPGQFSDGRIPAGTLTADPANDPQLLAETKDHYWFQFDTGTSMQDADPPVGATIGQTFTTSTGYRRVPDACAAR